MVELDKAKLLNKLLVYKKLMMDGYGLKGSRVDIIIHLIERIEKGDFDKK